MKTKLLGAALLVSLLAACNPQQAVPPASPGGKTSHAVDESSKTAEPLKVVNMSPRSTPANVAFNVQADGNSGISFELNKPSPASEFKATFDGKPLTGVVASGVIVTATIPLAYLSKAGSYPVALEIPASGTNISAGNFEVK